MSSPVSQNVRIALCIASVLFPFGCRDSTAPPAGAAFIVTAAENPVAGEQIIVKAQLVDAEGNPVRFSGQLVSWVTNYGQLGVTASVTGPDGMASTLLTTDTLAGRQHRVGAIDNQHGVSGISPPINTVAGLPATYTVVPSVFNPEVGSSFVISAQLGDRYHNPTKVAGRLVAWSNASGGSASGSFSSPTSTTDADGVATVNFTIGTQSNLVYVVSVSDDHQADGTSNPFGSRAGAMASYIVSPAVADPPGGAAIPVFAQAADAHGNPVVDIAPRQVQWSMTGSGGSLSTTTSQTDGGGTATVTLTTSAAPGATYTVSALDATGKGGTSPSITTTQQFSVASLSTGFGAVSSCGIATDGKAWCWGGNEVGQLGNGNFIDRAFPGRVAGNHTMTSLSAGPRHTCGIAGGIVLCWGENAQGQLGDNSLVSRSVPTPINSSATFTSVSAGGNYTCAIATGGDAYCWGAAAVGRLGDGNQGTISPSPVKVAGGLSFAAVTAGAEHTCGLTIGGDAYCWGSNSAGMLGDGSLLPALTPRAVSGGLKFTSISVGETHTCGISGGKAYCWGDHQYGQLGLGAPLTRRNTPAQVAGGLTVVAISAGGFHTCAIASDAKAYCWGHNSTSELGDADSPGSTAYSSVPIAVAGGLAFSSIAVGGGIIASSDDYYYYYYYSSPGGHSCGVTTSGVAYCWGANTRGELGSGPYLTLSRAPVRVSGQP